jgi:hypothetical protein
VPRVTGYSANIVVQAMEVARSNSFDRAGDQARRPTSDFGGLGLTLIGVGAWRRTPCGVSTNDGVLRLSVACGRAVKSSSAREAIGPAANATNRATDKGFMRLGEWKRPHRQDSLPLPSGPQTGNVVAVFLGPVVAAFNTVALFTAHRRNVHHSTRGVGRLERLRSEKSIKLTIRRQCHEPPARL